MSALRIVERLSAFGLDIEISRNERTGMLVVDVETSGLDARDVHPDTGVPNIRIMVNEGPIRFAPDGSITETFE